MTFPIQQSKFEMIPKKLLTYFQKFEETIHSRREAAQISVFLDLGLVIPPSFLSSSSIHKIDQNIVYLAVKLSSIASWRVIRYSSDLWLPQFLELVFRCGHAKAYCAQRFIRSC